MASNSTSGSTSRSAGFISLSVLAHAGLLGALLFTPQDKRVVTETAGKGGQTVFIDNQEPGNQALAAAPAVAEAPAAEAPAASVAAAEPVVTAPAAAEEPIAPPVVAPKKVATMAKPKTHGLPDKARVKAKQPAHLTPPPEESKKLETVADSDIDPQATDKEAAVDEAIAPLATTDASSESASADEATNEEPAAAPAAAAAVAPAPVSEAPPQAAAAPVAAPAKTEASAQASGTVGGTAGSSSGSGPTDGPRGAGSGYGAPVGNGTEIVSAELRHPLANNPKPVYPMQDRLTGRQGSTSLIAQVGTDGSVSNVMVTKKSGSDLMDRAAADALKKWKFAQGSAAVIGKTFAFQLTNQPEIARAQLGR